MKKVNKKIWIINHYATEMFLNKSGRHYWFALNLLKYNYETTVFCSNQFHNLNGNININTGISEIKEADRIKFVFIKSSKSKKNGLKRILNMYSFYRNLLRYYKKYAKLYGKPDIILASSVHPLSLVAGIKISKRLKIPCISEVRDLWPETIFKFTRINSKSLIGKILLKGEKWIYYNSDSIIFTKEGDYEYLIEKKLTKNKGGKIDLKDVYYINNGIDIKLHNENIKKYRIVDKDLDSDKAKIIYTGAIRPINNIEKIIDAAELISKTNENIFFLIYGDGSCRKDLERRVYEKRLKNIKFKGVIDRKYIPYILSKSTINILNYSQQKYNWNRGNSSNKLFEYMASGKPVLSTVKMGYSIIEKYNCGYEMYDAKPSDIAKSIIYILNLENKEYLALCNNAKYGAKEFDYTILTKSLVNILNNYLEK
ncbi:glycosyltransferase family 4 protein [Candidatus Izemoplasma sp. B36]|uniref:glycosyltransferase family 4 protein n=1 Tax=Candidatus Izemoplasma sp. B36 TaxID=3242468 RepID=UPI0035566C11